MLILLPFSAAPHVLTCGHSFCFSDIHTMALNAFSLELDGFVNFHCPLCRVPILIPGYNPEVHKVAPPILLLSVQTAASCNRTGDEEHARLRC